MPAIPFKRTGVSDGAWDGPENWGRLKSDRTDLTSACAWVDPKGNPDAKASYKGIHHDISADGTPGTANMKGCVGVVAVLNGGRSGIDVPDSDRRGVYDHVAQHIKDAGGTAPPLMGADGAPSSAQTLAKQMMASSSKS